MEEAVEASSGDTAVGAIIALEGNHKVGTTVYAWCQVIAATRVNIAMDENLVADRLPSLSEL